MKRTILLVVVTLFLFNSSLKSDEGMWIPILIEQFNIKMMQEKGFKLTAEDIYSVNQACLKDAVVKIPGCTGEMISGNGLMITNYHCGDGYIQRHSSIEHDYLNDGFWAMSQEEELANPGMTAVFLKYMEDVTERVTEGLKKKMTESERKEIIDGNIMEIVNEATADNDFSAYVRPFYMGNQYFLFVNETYRDVRLVGAPPSAIGKFGGDTDNWVFPRHTGDFSLFRIYANKDNNPANYSEDNVPYKPAHFFPISLKGVHEKDFTMVFGYPGGTAQYVPSNHISMLIDYQYPKMIDVRTAKLDIMNEAMNSDPVTRIQYYSKKNGLSNSWKRWIGEKSGMEKLGTVQKKKDFEAGFTNWVNSKGKLKREYGYILDKYKVLYDEYQVYNFVNSYSSETLGRSGIEAVAQAGSFATLVDAVKNNANSDQLKSAISRVNRRLPGYFKNYDVATDKKLFVTLMNLYGANLDPELQADAYKELKELCNGDFSSIVDKIYEKSIFTDKERCTNFLENFDPESIGVVEMDPLYKLSIGVSQLVRDEVRPRFSELSAEIGVLNRLYMKAQLEYAGDKVLWADANSTLRVSFGNVGGYDVRDAVYHTHFTSLKGIMEKDNPEVYDYDVPEKLRELYKSKDFGKYAQEGDVPVCFIANNHTTGGNSGSPVLNAEGHLIGINFDRAWEGVMSDLMFNPKQSRNISLDIRFALFIIDKFAGAGYLIEEMTLVE